MATQTGTTADEIENTKTIPEVMLMVEAYTPPKKDEELTPQELGEKYNVPEKKRFGYTGVKPNDI